MTTTPQEPDPDQQHDQDAEPPTPDNRGPDLGTDEEPGSHPDPDPGAGAEKSG